LHNFSIYLHTARFNSFIQLHTAHLLDLFAYALFMLYFNCTLIFTSSLDGYFCVDYCQFY